MKTRTYSALSHFNFETRHGAHESSTLDRLGGVSEAVPAAGLACGLLSIASSIFKKGSQNGQDGKRGVNKFSTTELYSSSREGFSYPARSAPPRFGPSQSQG